MFSSPAAERLAPSWRPKPERCSWSRLGTSSVSHEGLSSAGEARVGAEFEDEEEPEYVEPKGSGRVW